MGRGGRAGDNGTIESSYPGQGQGQVVAHYYLNFYYY